MSHSKRNTSLAFFTSYERAQLKSHWGSQATRLSRDSFLPFASCRLCLQIARDPVACAANGDLFCRECAVNNLIAQLKEIKRLKKEDDRRRKDEEQAELEKADEERERAVSDFEKVMVGLEGSAPKAKGAATTAVEPSDNEGRGLKRKFELDEEEMLRNVKDERAKAREALDADKSARETLPSFWVPSLTPSSAQARDSKPLKLQPICPASLDDSPHTLSLKSLVSVRFSTSNVTSTRSSESSDEIAIRICPACKKSLSNGLKAMLAIPCGHVVCRPCVDKFMTQPNRPPDPHAEVPEEEGMRCYVCEEDLTDRGSRLNRATTDKNGGKAEKGKEKERLKPGLVEIAAEGTGFAGGGKNMAKREGVAFQC